MKLFKLAAAAAALSIAFSPAIAQEMITKKECEDRGGSVQQRDDKDVCVIVAPSMEAGNALGGAFAGLSTTGAFAVAAGFALVLGISAGGDT